MQQQALWSIWAIKKQPVPFGSSSNCFLLGLPDNERHRRHLEINFSTNSDPAKVLNLWGRNDKVVPPMSMVSFAGLVSLDCSGDGVRAWASLTQKQWTKNFG